MSSWPISYLIFLFILGSLSCLLTSNLLKMPDVPSHMRAVVFKSVGKVVVEDRPMPQIQDPRDVIVKVKAAGLCGSDLHWFRGHQKIPGDFIPGHEVIGDVFQIGGGVEKFKVGDSVVVCFWLAHHLPQSHVLLRDQRLRRFLLQASFSTQCGSCFYCRKKQTSRCPDYYLLGMSQHHVAAKAMNISGPALITIGNRSTDRDIDGGQAEYVRIPFADTSLSHPPKGLPERLLVLMGDIFPTGYFCASRFLQPMSPQEAKDTIVAVVGCGPVGICAIAAALTWADAVYAIDLIPERLAEAEKIGAKPLRLDEDPVGTIQTATDGRGADLALELVGGPEPFQLCLRLIRPFGIISSVGVQAHDLTLHGPTLHAKNVKVEWGRCPVYGIFDEALECLVKVQDKVSFLCDREMKLEDAVEAYRLFDSRKVHKIILVP